MRRKIRMLSGQDLFNLQNRVAIVTGGSKGLGFEIAAALAGAGAEVLITSRNQQEIEAAAAAITRESGSRAVGLASDVTEPDKVQMMVDTALQRWGKVDILVNNVPLTTPSSSTMQIPLTTYRPRWRMRSAGGGRWTLSRCTGRVRDVASRNRRSTWRRFSAAGVWTGE